MKWFSGRSGRVSVCAGAFVGFGGVGFCEVGLSGVLV